MSSASQLPIHELRSAAARFNTRYWLLGGGSSPWTGEDAAPVPPTDRFLSYEPWPGGFNNVRMSLEMAAALALLLNRTLVWSPETNIYLRGKSSLDDFFDRADVQRGLSIVQYEEFARTVGLQPAPERGGRGRWFFRGLRRIPGAVVLDRESHGLGSKLLFCWPRCPKEGQLSYSSFAAYRQSLRAIDAQDPELSAARVLHFRENLLGNFYNFIWTEEVALGAAIKRFVRDRIHYREDLFARAERIVEALGGSFAFSCLHVRRNDFQYKAMKGVSGAQILNNTRALFSKAETLYIATDDRIVASRSAPDFDPASPGRASNRSYFSPLSSHFRTAFLSDFLGPHLARDTHPRLLGCIDQIICSRARVFVGTYFSTFTSYIQRLRGYMGDVRHKGILYHHLRYPEDYRTHDGQGLRLAGSLGRTGPSWSAIPGGHPFWGREYLEAWEDTEAPIFR